MLPCEVKATLTGSTASLLEGGSLLRPEGAGKGTARHPPSCQGRMGSTCTSPQGAPSKLGPSTRGSEPTRRHPWACPHTPLPVASQVPPVQVERFASS